jgi:hypothetical protein
VTRIQARVLAGVPEFMVVTVFILHIVVNDPPVFGSEEDHV